MGASFTAARTALTISAHSSVGSDGPDWAAHAQPESPCSSLVPRRADQCRQQQRSLAVRSATQWAARRGAALPDASDLSALSTASWSLASSAGSGPSWSKDVPA